MKNALLFVFLISTFAAYSQTEKPVIKSKSISVATIENPLPINKPLLVINNVVQEVKNEEEFHKKVSAIEPATIDSMSVLKSEEARLKYGNKGSNGALEIVLKKQ